MPVISAAGIIPALEDYFAQFPGDRQPVLFGSGPVQPTARRVIRHGPRSHYVGYFFSRKNNCHVPFESAIEKDACLLFEGARPVRRYLSQPAEIQFRMHGRRRKTTPDFELICDKRRVYVEVKPEGKTRTAAFKDRVVAIKSTGTLDGRNYRVLTDVEIRGPELPQIAALYENARWRVSRTLIKVVAGWLINLPDGTLYEDAADQLKPYPMARCALDGMILDSVIRMDLGKPLGQQPIVTTEALRSLSLECSYE
jgi:hypothetical protein